MTTLLATTASRMELSDEQKQALLATAAELIAAAASDRSPQIDESQLAGMADLPVAGVFVSLKRDKHLRACTGGLRQNPVALGQALADAAESTVLRDSRFPVVSPGEVAFLDVEIWLLDFPQPVQARGEDRVRAVITGGKHGLVVQRGGQHGLLLPGVALENGWDSRTFLEHVCQKAGMHPSLWKDDGTTLLTFEGVALCGRLRDFLDPTEAPPLVDREELAGYFDFCWDNIVAMFQGSTLRYFEPSLRDVAVNGVTLRLKTPQIAEPILLTNLSLRPTSPVQNWLLQLAHAGAHQLAARGIRLDSLHTVGMGMTLFGDPHLHGTLERNDLRGLDPAKRAALVIERNKQGLVFGPDLTPTDLVASAAELAKSTASASAAVFSLQALSTDKRLTFSTAPHPRRGPAERPPAVAGAFYPAHADSLRKTVDELLAESRTHALPKRPVAAAMVPHAGLRYSGAIAARVLQSIELPRTIFVVGPKHTPMGMDWAVAPHQTWQIPGAEIASDFMLARRLCRAIPGLHLDFAAHQREHAIEVELPLLARLAPESKVIGMALAGGNWAAAAKFAEGLASLIGELPEPPLLVISSDMNHYATDAENRRLDEIALSALERLDPEFAFKEINGHNISMCGVFPAVIVMETLRRLGRLHTATRCGYATSADVSGDKSRVVGYAGMLFS